jgi:biopolymer transport protein ExbD
MAGVIEGDDGIVSGINVTPLVDIMLVLLVVFMVTAKLTDANAIPLDLPKAASGGEVQTVFTVTVGADGTLFVDGARIDGDDALRASARAALAKTPELRTVLRASAGASYGSVLHVMDELRESGVQKIAFAADPKAAPQAR